MGMEIRGIEALSSALDGEKGMRMARRVISRNTANLDENMKRRAVFKGHYRWEKGVGRVFKKPTGATKRSIRPRFEKGGLEGIVGPHTEYAFYVELGTRFMSAQPFVRPALKAIEPEFIKDMARTLGGKK